MSSEWGTVSFAEAPFSIIDGDRGANYPKQHEFSSDGYCLFLNAGNVTANGFDFSDCAFVSKDKDSMLRKGKLVQEDLVLTTRGTLGNVAYYSQGVPFPEIRINSGMVILRPVVSQIIPRYLYLFLRSNLFKEQVLSLRSGSAQPQLPIRDMHRIEMPFPSLAVQNEIVCILGALDDRIALLRETNATLEAIAQALFKSWFVDFDPVRAKMEGRQPEGMDESTAALFPDSFEESELGLVPRGWVVGKIEDICQTITNGGTPSRSNKAYWEDGETPWFKTGDFSDGFLLSPSERITQVALKTTAVKVLPENAVLMAIYAAPTVGRLGVLTEPAAFNQACTGMVAHTNIGPWFLYWTLYFGRVWFNSRANGAAQQNISKAIVAGYKIIIPSDGLLEEFNEVIAPIQAKIRTNTEQSRNLEDLRDTLLPRLISGQLPLQEAAGFPSIA